MAKDSKVQKTDRRIKVNEQREKTASEGTMEGSMESFSDRKVPSTSQPVSDTIKPPKPK